MSEEIRAEMRDSLQKMLFNKDVQYVVNFINSHFGITASQLAEFAYRDIIDAEKYDVLESFYINWIRRCFET